VSAFWEQFFGAAPATLISIAVLVSVLKSKKIIRDTHTLVNSRMGIQLRLTAVALHRLAIITKEPGDIEAAQLAQAQYDEHISQQSIVDAGKT
jgi:hypothetical protein